MPVRESALVNSRKFGRPRDEIALGLPRINGPRLAWLRVISMLRLTTTIAEDGSLTIHIAGRLTPHGCNAIDEILKDARKPLRPGHDRFG